MSNPTPEVGRHVHYFEHVPSDSPQAAIIVHVHSDTMVNLTVFDRNGHAVPVTSVELVPVGAERPEYRHCTWMPYHVQSVRQQSRQGSG